MDHIEHTARHCYFASLYQLLKDSYPWLSESLVYFMSGGMELTYKEGFHFDYEGYNEKVLHELSYHLQIPVKYSFRIQRNQLLDELDKGLCDGGSILLFMNSKFLDYHPIYAHNPNRTHAIILHAIEEEQGLIRDYLLLDDGGNIHTYEGYLAMDRLLSGVWGWAYFNPLEVPKAIEQDAISWVEKAWQVFLDDRRDEREVCRGVGAYEAYMAHLIALAKVPDGELRKISGDIYYQLRMGSVVTMLTYLKDILMLSGKEPISQNYIESIEELLLDWKRLMLNIYKMGIRRRRQMIEPLTEKAIALHEKFVRLLRKMIACQDALDYPVSR